VTSCNGRPSPLRRRRAASCSTKPALGLHRAAEIHRRLGEVGAVEASASTFSKRFFSLDVDRLVDHEARAHPSRLCFAQVDHGARKGAFARCRASAIRN